jgi:flagellar motor switch protein FliN/FliY
MTAQGAHGHTFEEVKAAAAPSQHLNLEDLRKVRLNVTVELGNARMLVREILELKQGSVVPLSKLAGEMADILCNDLPFAKGEIVVIGDSLHVRIAEITGATDANDDANSPD